MWLLDKLATRYHTRPSELLGIDQRFDAYCLDEATMMFCSAVQGKIDSVPTPKGKRAAEKREKAQEALLKQLLRIPETEKKPAAFRDPAEMFRR